MTFPDRGHGPCSDCQPDDTFTERLRRWWSRFRLPRPPAVLAFA